MWSQGLRRSRAARIATNTGTVASSSKKTDSRSVFKAGAVSLAFLVLGYQVALFVHRSAVEKIATNRDMPDTVYVVDRKLAQELLSESGRNAQTQDRTADSQAEAPLIIRKPSQHSPVAEQIASGAKPESQGISRPRRRVESFRFNPNTVGLDDLIRLGFSEKQAQSIINYREKGGRFRRKSDFAKSYVVADSVYKRLESFIDIPKTDINKADSAAFDALPGVGGWTAAKMVEYRTRLRGYSCPEQLMEIYHFDRERYDGLKDLIVCSPVEAYPFWSLPADSLRLHPHVRSWQTARAIVFYREHNPPDKWSIDGLLSAGILNEDQAEKLRKCRLK